MIPSAHRCTQGLAPEQNKLNTPVGTVWEMVEEGESHVRVSPNKQSEPGAGHTQDPAGGTWWMALLYLWETFRLTGPKQGAALGTIPEGHPVVSIKSIRTYGLALECTCYTQQQGRKTVFFFFNTTGKRRDVFLLPFRGHGTEH